VCSDGLRQETNISSVTILRDIYTHNPTGPVFEMIGLDLDGVVCDLLGAARRAFGEPACPQAYSFEEMYPHVSDDILASFFHHQATYARMRPIPGATESIAKLLALGTKIVYVTSRPAYLYQPSSEWLRVYGIQAPLRTVLSKEVEVRRLGIDIFVDDNPDVLAKLDCATYLFSQPYNLFRASKAIRVTGWAELLGRLL